MSNREELVADVKNSVRQCLIQILKTDSGETQNDGDLSDDNKYSLIKFW